MFPLKRTKKFCCILSSVDHLKSVLKTRKNREKELIFLNMLPSINETFINKRKQQYVEEEASKESGEQEGEIEIEIDEETSEIKLAVNK